MSMILYRNGKIVGPITEWQNSQSPPQYKDVLGKTVLVSKSNDLCSFVSPKPVNRKDELSLVLDGQTKLLLEVKKITGGLHVSALVKEKRPLKI